MDREKLQKLIATSMGIANDDDPIVLHLECIDDEITLKPISKMDLTRLGVVQTKGDEADVEADVLVALLKYSAVDNQGKPLFRNVSEATAFVNFVGDRSTKDLAELLGALGALAKTQTERLVGSVEAGKAS